VPDALVRRGIEQAYAVSELVAGQANIKLRAGVKDLAELKHKPLEDCDKLAIQVGFAAKALTLAEGAATGAGGMLTTLLDIPILFVLALRTIIKIGHCYGYPLDRPRDQVFVLGVLLAATSPELATRRQRLHRLREVEDWLLDEAQQDLVLEELASFLFQLEIFEGIPGIGLASGALLNLGFMHRVDVASRRVFQENWLRDNGKVHLIEPAHTHARALAAGWSGALSRAAHRGAFYLGYGATIPVWLVVRLFRGVDNAATLGLRNGAAAARDEVGAFLDWARGLAAANGKAAGTPALEPA
jgi:hypothetical protein